MEFEVKKFEKIEDGKHTGVISKVEYRTEPHAYTDVFVKLPNGVELKYGCPSGISEKTKMGRLLSGFVKLVPEQMLDPEVILKDQQVSFMTITVKKENQEFTNIVEDSINPLVIEETV